MAGSPIVRSKAVLRDAAGLQRALLAWYRRHRRTLPWRASRDPYRVWVSEVMLQQTQVATATPYYERFVALFPTVRVLAQADPARVLAAWAGLGYYRRARQLHEAAGIVVREHAGRVPSDPRAFGALPGVGRYTLGAVLSIGFGSPLPVLDGNVARVLARLTARPLSVRRAPDARTLWAMAEALLPGATPAGTRRAASAADRGVLAWRGGADPGDWNQALMELGATLCTPRTPRCGACPVRGHCRAFALGQQERFPPAAERRAPVVLRRAIAVLERRGRTLVVRRTGALLHGMWEPPGLEIAPGRGALAPLVRALSGLGIKARLTDTGARLKHVISHRSITVEVWRAELVGESPRASSHTRWAVPGSRSLALTALARRVIDNPPPAIANGPGGTSRANARRRRSPSV